MNRIPGEADPAEQRHAQLTESEGHISTFFSRPERDRLYVLLTEDARVLGSSIKSRLTADSEKALFTRDLELVTRLADIINGK